MFRAGQTTEVTFYIRKVIWSTSGSDYLLNHNKTTHSIFVRRGMEGYSFHFTHLLVNDFWVKNWWKSQSQQKASQWCFSVTSARHRAGFPHRTSQRAQRFFFFFFKSKYEKKYTKLLWKWFYSVDYMIQYRSLIGSLHGSVFDYCLSFLSNVTYCVDWKLWI